MKRFKLKFHYVISSILVVVLMATTLFAINNTSENYLANDHSSCVWNHYNKLTETSDDNGCKEYWVCCSHHDVVLDEPSQGVITHKGQVTASFANNLANDDSRVLLSYTKQALVLDEKISELPSDEKISFNNFETINKINHTYENMNEETKAKLTKWKSFSSTKKYCATKYPALFDASCDIFTNRAYMTSTYNLARNVDEKIGNYVTLSNIKGHDTFWIIPNCDLSLSKFDTVHFYLTASIDTQIEFRAYWDYSAKLRINVKANEWSLVTLDISEYGLNLISDVGIAIWKGTDFALDYDVKISSFYGDYKQDDFGKTKIFDASTGSIRYINYEASFNQNRYYESELGFDYIECSNIYNETDGLWLGPNSNVSVGDYSYIYFYFKCSLEKGFEVREHHHYHIDQIVKAKANEWIKISIEVNETNFVDGILSDIGIDNWFQHTPETAGVWCISSFYGVREHEKLGNYIIPRITSDKNIDFTAYGIAPGRSKEVADNNFTVAREAGFTKAIGLLDGRNETLQDEFQTKLQNYLNSKTESNKAALFDVIDSFCASIEPKNNMIIESAYDHGIGYYALSCILYDFRMFAGNCSYTVDDYDLIISRILDKSEFILNPKYFGLFYLDEPSVAWGSSYIKKFYEKYRTLTDKEAFLNLLPMNSMSDKTTYNTYLNNYFGDIYKYNKYISYDMYPILRNEIRDAHLYNLEVIANRLKSQDKFDYRTFIYSLKGINDNSAHAPVDSVADLSLQIYSNLAFGSSDIAYYVYSSNTDYGLQEEEDKTNGLINIVDYSPSELYYYAKEINNEVHSFEKAYRHFKWDAILASGDCSQFNNLASRVYSYGKLSSVSGSEDTLVGCFKDRGTSQGFLVLNYQNSNESSYVDVVTLSFNNASHVLVYKDGDRCVYPLSSGQYSFNLNVADAAFVIPLSL